LNGGPALEVTFEWWITLKNARLNGGADLTLAIQCVPTFKCAFEWSAALEM
jgi:hypothetical protein